MLYHSSIAFGDGLELAWAKGFRQVYVEVDSLTLTALLMLNRSDIQVSLKSLSRQHRKDILKITPKIIIIPKPYFVDISNIPFLLEYRSWYLPKFCKDFATNESAFCFSNSRSNHQTHSIYFLILCVTQKIFFCLSTFYPRRIKREKTCSFYPILISRAWLCPATPI